MSEELKPCPFCAGNAEIVDNRLEWYVECTGCGVVVIGDRVPELENEADSDSLDWNAVKLSAIKAWNTRQIPEDYKLVPIEPTVEMCIAAWDKHYCNDEGAIALYKAMIEAAV